MLLKLRLSTTTRLFSIGIIGILGCVHTLFDCLPGPNASSIAPLSPCPHLIVFTLYYVGLNRGAFASMQQLLPLLLGKDYAGEAGKIHSIACLTFMFCFQSVST